jgi:hypothetical protein|tara:strand:+ start:813 stop:980 length:168 start_codon:yes stop_codon:yes gene_type:complete
MTYEEAMDGREVTYAEMVHEMRKHGVDDAGFAEFFREYGVRDTYQSFEILDWLGY